MDKILKRRTFLSIVAATVVAGCGGLKPYTDQGPKNITMRHSKSESTFFVSRRVWVDVYRGAKAYSENHIGTEEITTDGIRLGLPENEPVLLVIVFEQGGGSVTTSVREQVLVRSGQQYQLITGFGADGYEYDLKRIR